MDLEPFLKQSSDLWDEGCVADFAAQWQEQRLDKGAHLVWQEHSHADEFILLEGCLVSSICDPDGKEVCVGLYVGPCVVTPSIARTRGGVSLVTIVATAEARVVRMGSDELTRLMIASEPIRDWANGVLREALGEKAEREWCLAALGGRERLAWFREAYPGYEDIFTHGLIATFLGMTPVTMSRLRGAGGEVG